MILIDNINFLRNRFPSIREKQKTIEENFQEDTIQREYAKNGTYTIKVKDKDDWVYLHSKYDPINEADKIISQFETIKKYKHVLFYGIGLGYHIEQYMNRHPEMSCTIYEPNPIIFQHFLQVRSLEGIKNLSNIFVEYNSSDLSSHLDYFVNQIKEEVLLVILPSYGRVFKEKIALFSNQFQQKLKSKTLALATNFAFGKRWILNSFVNLKEVYNSACIHDKKEYFKNKPALLVAAGPSLEEEIENIRFIKENGLAYIISVGSAINALLGHGVFPDAACTYDPTVENQMVFEKLKQKDISTIPLIFGSSVGFETLQGYPGPKLHMVTSQDKIAAYYLKRKDSTGINVVDDAPSIAVITLQLLNQLKCNPIILVGQNFAFKNDQIYSKGISYDQRPTEMTESDWNNSFTVKDVNGNDVLTNDSFNSMRKQMETYMQIYPNTEYINTTNGGAHISGSKFIHLEEVIRTKLDKYVVKDLWYSHSGESIYDIDFIKQQIKRTNKEFDELLLLLEQIIRVFKDIDQLVNKKNVVALDRIYPKFDKYFNKIRKNKFFNAFIAPMNRVEHELLLKNANKIRFERDSILKGAMVIQEYGKFIYLCKKDVEFLRQYIKEIHKSILENLEENQYEHQS